MNTTPSLHDFTYSQMLTRVLLEGDSHADRTGVGTTSVFGYQNRYDLANGFPLLTTKRMAWKSIVVELAWFLLGRTDNQWLEDRGVTIWREWATAEQCAKFGRAEGDLGPVYGHAWRSFGGPYPLKVEQPTPNLRDDLPRQYLGVGCGIGKQGHPLAKRWEGMMARCYDPSSIGYPLYGARGVYVCDRWLEFAAFAEDAVKLPGYNAAQLDAIQLDKDGVGTGYCYSPATCQWLTASENVALTDSRVFVLERDGVQYRVTNVAAFCAEQGADGKNMSDLWTGRKNAKQRYGFRLVRVEDRASGVDQIKALCADLATNPNSRRLIVTGWNPVEATQVALPPCHTLWQCKVREQRVGPVMESKDCETPHTVRYLDLHLYQRSADAFLGVPFNIASYALLLQLLAHTHGMFPGRFIHTFGDLHIYNNHREQVATQQARAPFPAPRVFLPDSLANRGFDGVLEWAERVGQHALNPANRFRDDAVRVELDGPVLLAGYQCHDSIKAEVAV